MLEGEVDAEASASPEATRSPFCPNKIAADLEEDGDDVPLDSDPPPASKLRLECAAAAPSSAAERSSAGSAPEEPIGCISVTINDFERRGEGMNAFIVYKIITKVSCVPGFTRENYEVWRRFSDFLGLHEKLLEKYLSKGVLLPSPPEKSIVALTRTKTSSEAASARDVAVARSRQLQRFLARLVLHPITRTDCDVRDFLTLDADLPRASNTSALSSVNVKKMLKSVGEAFTKIAVHMEEGDRWFEQTQSQLEELEDGVRRMHSVAEGLAATHRDLKAVGDTFSKALSMLASCEESTALARALSHLTETEESVASLWERQAEAETAELVEALSEYVALFTSLKNVFAERHRVWNAWQNAQQNITRKREQKTRLELAGKTDKAAAVRAETEEAVAKADELENQFARVSDAIRVEVKRFEQSRKREMKDMLITFLESVIATQNEMLLFWQRFAPETDAIIA